MFFHDENKITESFFAEKYKKICQFKNIDISLHRKNAMAR